jgi:drug/metabolite transporter (DMT)-like permease
MTMTSISNSTIIVNSAPIFVALIYFIFFKESLNRQFFISLGVTLSWSSGFNIVC